MPREAILLRLCETFHCRPSELHDEDGFLLLRLLDVQHWRDAASYYDEDPSSKAVPEEDKIRMMLLAAGDPQALTRGAKELSPRHVDPRYAFVASPAKKADLKAKGRKFDRQVKQAKLINAASTNSNSNPR